MLQSFKKRLATTRLVRRIASNPVDLEAFKQKPSPKFILGLTIIGISYITTWPLITLLGILAVCFKKPLLFAVGSPAAYAVSHLMFMLGAFIAGKDTVVYMNIFLQWSLAKGMRKFLGKEIMAELTDLSDSKKQ